MPQHNAVTDRLEASDTVIPDDDWRLDGDRSRTEKDYRVSPDERYAAVEPVKTDTAQGPLTPLEGLPYREAFDAAMRHTLAYAHNFGTLEDAGVPTPGFRAGVTRRDDAPWPYFSMEHVVGTPYTLYDDDDPDQYDPDIDEAYHAINATGQRLAIDERAISYPYPLQHRDLIIPDDDDRALVHINPGMYLADQYDTDPTLQQFERSSIVPGPETVAEWCDPGHWEILL